MSKRLLLSLLLCAELVVAAVFYVALRFGRFDQSVGFYLYLLTPLVVLSIAVGFVVPLDYLRRAGSHGLLLLGCIAFALPFVWLVSTSFKYEEEVFVYPPKWIPSTPSVISKSPYVTTEDFDAKVQYPKWH